MDTQNSYLASKPHYEILDGLRGVASVMVVAFHLLEAHSGGSHLEQLINHGYLAVDFFFMLSGFVIGYAYDDRWNRMSVGTFFKRRIIRLHPMVIVGSIIGAVFFYFQESPCFPAIQNTSVGTMLLVMLLGCTLLSLPLKWDIRGWTEMHPLNGPAWSLYYEYIGNILYALFIRRLSNKALAVLVVLLGMALASFAVFNVSGYGNMGVGWTLDGVNFLGGTLRMLFPFSLGMLMSRNFKPMKVNGAFWICTIILIALFSVPYLEGLEPICMNGIYEAFCVIAVFPFLVWLGASGTTTDKQSTKICKFLGDISYPVYVVHYPLMYLFYAWLIENKLYTLGETWYVAVGVFVLSVILACLCLKLYDEPVRKWLSKKFLAPK